MRDHTYPVILFTTLICIGPGSQAAFPVRLPLPLCKILPNLFGVWSSGRTLGSGPSSEGSNPSTPAAFAAYPRTRARASDRTPATELAVNRELIEVRLYGAAGPTTVVLLHGGPGAPGSVADLAADLAASRQPAVSIQKKQPEAATRGQVEKESGCAADLASGFHVLEPLQRRAGSVPLTVEQHVDDLAAVAPDSAAFVGHSWGAMLALSFAAHHPHRVRSLTLIGCGTYDQDARAAYRAAVDRRLNPDDRARIDEIDRQLEAASDQADRDRLFAEFGRIFNRVDSFDPVPHTPTPLSADERGFNETWTHVLRLQESGIEPAAFSSIDAPVLMLHGDDDPHPGPAIRDTLLRHIPHLKYTGLPRCGHFPWRERHAREPFLDALRHWLSTHSG